MNRVALIVAGVAAGLAAWAYTRRREVAEHFWPGADWQAGIDEWGGTLSNALENIGLDSVFGFVRVSNMSRVDRALVNHPNVRAMLRVIRQGESSQNDALAYRLIVGGQTFSDFSDHPGIFGKCWTTSSGTRQCSSAAGAYQITKTTWGEVKRVMGLNDFSPPSQDLAALGRIAYRGALPAVLAGDVETAVRKLRLEWTSLPGAAENNKAAGDIENAKRLFVAWGGAIGQAYA